MEIKEANQKLMKYFSEKHPCETMLTNLEKITMLNDYFVSIFDDLELKTDDVEFDYIDTLETLSRLDSYYKSVGIDIDLNYAINFGYVNIKYSKIIDKKSNKFNGRAALNKKLTVDASNLGNTHDGQILAHEFSHALNFGLTGDNDLVVMFTEALAIFNELYYLDFISPIDNKAYYCLKIEFEKYIKLTKYILPALHTLNIFNKFNDISKYWYSKIYEKEKYQQELIKAHKILMNSNNVFKAVQYTFGFQIAIYLFEKCKQDPTFIHNIEEFNDALLEENDLSILSLIGLKDLGQEDMYKIIKSFNSIKNGIEINEKDYKRSK